MNTCQIIYSGGFLIVLIIAIILFSLSFKVVDINHYALKRNTYNRKIDEGVVYRPGRYMSGIQGEFVQYSSTWQYIHFSNNDNSHSPPILGKTIDNDTLRLEISIVYRLKPEFLETLNKDYPNQNHKKDMITAAKDVILKITPLYQYQAFYNLRHLISNQMSQEINEKFKNVFQVEMTLFLLREIILEDKYEQKIIQNLIKEQERDTTTMQNQLKIKEGDLAVIISDTETEVFKIQQLNQSKALAIQSELIGKGQGQLLLAESKGYQAFKNKNFDGSDPDPNLPQTMANWDTSNIIKYIHWLRFVQAENIDLYMGISQNARVEI